MKWLTEEILTFGDALESQWELSLENPEHKGDISFRLLQVAWGYLQWSEKPCEGCRHILRNTKWEVALIFITHWRIVPIQETGRPWGLVMENAYIVCWQTCDDPTTPDEYIPDEQRGLPLVNVDKITHCDKRQGLS